MATRAQRKEWLEKSMNPLCQRPLTRTHISERNAAASPLLRLPPELRNSIFAYALYHERFVLDPPDSSGYVVKSRDKNLLSLLYVCRQIYSETAYLPYKLNSFEICRDSPVSLVAFLKRRTATQIELMRDVIRRWNMPSPEKHSEGAKSDPAPHANPIFNDIVDITPDRSTELAIASHPAAARDEISKRNADSPLLRLPAELRNNIFALALTQGDIKWNYGAWLKNKNSVNLLYVCLASTKRNATSSPLLRLPPEIRNHIFSLALNHGYIPIIFPERSHRWKIKRAEHQGFEYRYHYKQFCNIFYNPISFSARSCSFKLKKRPVRNSKRLNHLKRPVNLLFVCRQIHAETALLPYKVNTWVIELNRPWERIREGATTDADSDMDLEQQPEEARAQITQHNATASPLLRLPAEIRNMIFAYALSHGDIKLNVIPRLVDSDRRRSCWKHRNWANPINISLLYACRQIQHETALLPYELNVFVICGNISGVRDFLELRTSAQIGAMARVRREMESTTGVRPATEWLELVLLQD
ncbi:uncharacterized protein J4E79_010958 [Alternaria viburni]|uniref:uncharacterized protein n=1 Tax=Alternaria viburni TaxID=566460 RepID=UPI0020C4BDE6|nr:uncharacterized protein J4E79_010958 [Alternaria viburni]KAI4644823.1 hypothetical protein J4E79_010958 [Alternaria viburni]